MLALPHDPDVVVVLRAFGYQADAPILHDAEAFAQLPFEPYYHQRAGAAFITMNERGFVLFPLGTGKTITTLLGLRWLRRKGLVRSVLVVAPLSTIKDVWEREIYKAEPFARVQVLHAERKERLRRLRQDADYYVINHDGIKVLADELVKHELIDAVVIDESTAFKNKRTARWKAMNAIVNKAPHRRRCYALTGTPAPQQPTDAWAQSRLVVPGVAPKTFTLFRDMTMVPVGPHRWEPKQNAADKVMAILKPHIYVDKAMCFDLPPITYIDRKCELTKAQKKLENDLRKEWMAELETGRVITAANAAVRLSKLLQIYQGCVITHDVDAEPVDCQPRLELLQELAESSDRAVLVFVPFRGPLKQVVEHLSKNGVATTWVDGSVPQKTRQKRFDAFRKGEFKVLVAQPATVSHGLSFTNADTAIWYGPYFSVEGYLQANQRMARPGQEHHMTIYHIIASPIERQVFDRLKKKINLHEKVVDLLKAAVGKEGESHVGSAGDEH